MSGRDSYRGIEAAECNERLYTLSSIRHRSGYLSCWFKAYWRQWAQLSAEEL